MNFEDQQRDKEAVLLQAGIVSKQTTCASFPLQLILDSVDQPTSYQHQFPAEFFDNPWPLHSNPRPLRATYDKTSKMWKYTSTSLEGRKRLSLFELSGIQDDIFQGEFEKGQCFFDCVTEIHGRRFRVVQTVLPPLHSPDTFTPVLTGGENYYTSKNYQPAFAYNADAGMIEVSPPVFRALALHFYSATDATRQPNFTPHLYASYLVSCQLDSSIFGGAEHYPFYCVLQFLEPPPSGTVRLHEKWPQYPKPNSSSIFPCEGEFLLPLLETQLLTSPFLIPNPVNLSHVYIEPAKNMFGMYEIKAFDSYDYGTMGIPSDLLCSSRNSGGNGITNAHTDRRTFNPFSTHPFEYNKPFRRFLTDDIRTRVLKDPDMAKTSVIPLFACPWDGQMTRLSLAALAANNNTYSVIRMWEDADGLIAQSIQTNLCMLLPKFFQKALTLLSRTFQNKIAPMMVEKKFSRVKDLSRQYYLAKPLLDNLGNSLVELTSRIDACQYQNTCSALQPVETDFVSHFSTMRNTFSVPDYNPATNERSTRLFSVQEMFSAFASSDTLFKSTLPHSRHPPLYYADFMAIFCRLRIQADQTQQILARPLPYSNLYQVQNSMYEFYNTPCQDVIHLGLVMNLYFLAGTTASLLQQILLPSSASSLRLTEFLCKSFFQHIKYLTRQMLNALVFMDAQQPAHVRSSQQPRQQQVFDDDDTGNSTSSQTTTSLDALLQGIQGILQNNETLSLWIDANAPIDTIESDKIGMLFDSLPLHQLHIYNDQVRDGLGYAVLVLYGMTCWMERVWAQRICNHKSPSDSDEKDVCYQLLDVYIQAADECNDSIKEFIFTYIFGYSKDEQERWKLESSGPMLAFLSKRAQVMQEWMTMLAGNIARAGRFDESFAAAQDPFLWQNLLPRSATHQQRPVFLVDKILNGVNQPAAVQLVDEARFVKNQTLEIPFAVNADPAASDALIVSVSTRVGKGGYGSVFSGTAAFRGDPTRAKLPLAVKTQRLELFDPLFDIGMQAYNNTQVFTLEVMAMLMLQQYGRWEEDPYIVSPNVYWSGCVSKGVTGEESGVIFMEYFDKDTYTTVVDWSVEKRTLQTSKDIIFERLNQYFDFMAYRSPIQIQFQDNKLDNVLIEKDANSHPRTAILVIIDPGISMFSVPWDEFQISVDRIPFVMDQSKVIQQAVVDGKITFFEDLYERAGLIATKSMRNNRNLAPLQHLPPTKQYAFKQIKYQ